VDQQIILAGTFKTSHRATILRGWRVGKMPSAAGLVGVKIELDQFLPLSREPSHASATTNAGAAPKMCVASEVPAASQIP
jgi:hypothetical protein